VLECDVGYLNDDEPVLVRLDITEDTINSLDGGVGADIRGILTFDGLCDSRLDPNTKTQEIQTIAICKNGIFHSHVIHNFICRLGHITSHMRGLKDNRPRSQVSTQENVFLLYMWKREE